MKLILMLMSICFFTTAEAGAAHKLNVEIQNLGADNCKLVNSQILHGETIIGRIPPYIPGSGMVFNFQVGLKKVPKNSQKAALIDAELQLTYQCGLDKQITLYMKQFYKQNYYHGDLIVKTNDPNGVNETHDVIAPERLAPRSGKPHSGSVRWMLWN